MKKGKYQKLGLKMKQKIVEKNKNKEIQKKY